MSYIRWTGAQLCIFSGSSVNRIQEHSLKYHVPTKHHVTWSSKSRPAYVSFKDDRQLMAGVLTSRGRVWVNAGVSVRCDVLEQDDDGG